jgi:hypothetical protein
VHYLCAGTVKNFLSYLFQKEKSRSVDPVDLSALVTDVHSHLLPGIDDGSPNLEESIHLIRSLHEYGYRKFITTPHIFKDLYPNTPEIILQKLAIVREELKRQHIQIELDAAAEYYLDEHFEEAIEKKTLLTFGNNYVLYELSFASEPVTFKRAIGSSGAIFILAQGFIYLRESSRSGCLLAVKSQLSNRPIWKGCPQSS